MTLWAGGIPSSTNGLTGSRLVIKTNETAHLLSWPQMQFHSSFLTISAGLESVVIQRKAEIEVDEKTKRVTENGVLRIPEVVVAGPATLELVAAPGFGTLCTVRIVQAPSSVVRSAER